MIDSFHYTPAKGGYDYVDMLMDHFDYCVSSSVTIHAEVGNYKLTVDKTKCAERGRVHLQLINTFIEVCIKLIAHANLRVVILQILLPSIQS